MIKIYLERCDGCGACLEACPEGALYLVDGRAAVDEGRCRECEACVAACPSGAIVVTEGAWQPVQAQSRVPAVVPRPEPEVIRVRTEQDLVPLRARVLPVIGAALTWAGREIMPRLADYFLSDLDRRTASQQVTGKGRRSPTSGSQSGRGGGGGGRQRHRHRGG